MSDLARVTRCDPRGMITFRGDLSASAVKKVIKSVTGQASPNAGFYVGTSERGVARMSPDELLICVPYADVESTLETLDKGLKGQHYLAVDVSDARAVFSVVGTQAAEVLARLCPVDLHQNSFAVGTFRRTRMAQIAAAFWRHDSGFDVICFRSVRDYAQGILENAATATATGALG